MLRMSLGNDLVQHFSVDEGSGFICGRPLHYLLVSLGLRDIP